jgi:fido (protein-threonine AMPylation protein)
MSTLESLPDETPLDDVSGLIPRNVKTRAQLNLAEAENILHALTKYLGGKLTPELAPFDLTWIYTLHREMFGKVWRWAGQIRTAPLNLGVPFHRIDADLYLLLEDLKYWAKAIPMP